MDKKELNKILKDHLLWLEDNQKGKHAYLQGAYLQGADLQSADLQSADLQGAYLQGADLRSAYLQGADLRGADLQGAYLQGADLRGAYLQGADLRSAYLRGAYLRGADLRSADLSNSKGLKTAKEYLSQFEKNKSGIYVYKAIGDTTKRAPEYWKIEPKSFLEEVANPDRFIDCGCGVNFATLEWVKNTYSGNNVDIWQCLILWEDMADVVVPFNTDGKARCARLQLIKVVK